ncbi:beta/gamma crystallin domain-containing protein 1-like isoform X2 [Carassius gibelio]|nr:beta/gamma crystallin domain-containing protein 1-like isoform X2 [Carassius gibelio]XP_052409990.1 beta/gamma crystallin domain-containing protein 1-like isoform X2 [Carassius gibelio]
MGRRRSSRKRRSSHGDGGGAKSPTSPQPESPEATSLTGGPRMTCADSAFEETPDSLPETPGAEAPNSGNREDVSQTHLSEDADVDSLARAALAYTDMDEERVVRLTESAESKRRSIKVSHSEVVFPKKLLVASEEQREDQKMTRKDTERLRSDGRARYPEDRADGTNVKSKGRIADKISLFERGATNAVSSSTNLRHLDISPARNVASRLFTERAGARSSSAPPNQTVKERAMNFNAGRKGGDNLTLPSGHTLSEGHSKTAEILQSERFEKSTAKTDTSGEPKVKSKPHLNIDQTDSKSHNATQSTSDSNIGNKELDSPPMVSSPTDETPEVKSPNQTSSRSKKRRGKDPRSPTKDKPPVDIVKTTEQYSDKERPDSSREAVTKTPKVPPSLEKAAEIIQSTKKISDSPHADTKFPKEIKSKDEKQHSSNEEKTERTEIDSKTEEKLKKQLGHERSEGQGKRNRDVIVNTSFGESGKPDPSVTKEEKPPSLEDLKEANAKDCSEPANNSTTASRREAMRNRGSETDTLVLPEKKTENTTESEPKSAQTPSKTNQNSTEVSTSKPTKQNEEEAITTKTTKHGKSKNTSAVRQEDTTVLPTNDGKENQTTELNSELSDQTKENSTTTSRTPATPNPTLVKDQNENTDAIISPQIPSTEEGGLKRDEPPLQNQSESGEEQKTQAVSNKSDLQQPSTDIKNGGTKETRSEITGTEITSVINGDIHTVQVEENALCSSLENKSEISKKKPTSLSSKASETCTEQSGQVTAEPAPKDDKAFGDNENTTLSNSANKKTNNEKTTLPPTSTNVITTPEKPTTVEKNTSPPASTNEKTSTLPTSTKENATGLSASTDDDENKPQPASTDETISVLPVTTNEQTTPPTGSANEQTTPPTASANEQTTPPTASANEQTTPPTASANEQTTPPTASANEQTTPPTGSANEQTTPPTASANEQTTPPTASANEQTTPPTASVNEQTTPPTASANEQTTPPTGSANEKTTPPTGSANEQTTPPTASANEKTTPPTASANEQTTPPTGSANEQTTPPTASANEQTTPPTASANEKTTPPAGASNEQTAPLRGSTTELTSPPTASGIDSATPLPAPTIETTCTLSDNVQTIPSASLTVRSPSTSLASSDEKNKPPPASSNENDTTPSESTSKMTTNENTISPQASTNGTTSTLPASPKEKTTPPPASTTETLSATLSSSDDISKLHPASTNETVSAFPDSANDKTVPSTASTNEKNTATIESSNKWTTNEETTSPQSSTNKTTSQKKTAPLPASITETISATLSSNDDKNKPSPTSTNEKTTSSLDSKERTTPPPASTNDTISTLTGLANEKNTPPTALSNEKAKPIPGPTIETTSTLSGSDNEKTTPSASSTIEFASSLLGSGDDATKPPSVLNNDKTTPPQATTKENAAPLQSSTNPPVSIDITTKNEKTTPLPTSSHSPLTSINGNNITPLPSSKEKTISPPDNDSSKATPSPEKPLGPEVSAKEKIFSIKSTTPSTRKNEFILKPFHLPQIPAAPGSSSQSRDSPSSWLDVDHQRPLKKKLLIPDPKLSSSASETNLLNTSGEFDPDDFIANVKRLAMPFNLPLRKHNKHRLQAPPFAMPAIKEDHFEKPFDPEEFQYGLRRRREFILDLPSSSKSKSQAAEVKDAEIKPKRESILTRSVIFQRARKGSEKVEEEKVEGTDVNTTEKLKPKSRLERCSIVSVLRSPSKGRRMEFLSPTESPSGGLLSPSDGSGYTAPPELQLAPTIEPTKLVPIAETLVKNNSHDTLSGSQVILKSSSDIGLAMTPDLKTSSRDPTVSLLKDSSGSQASSQVVPTPTKDDGPTLAPDLKANSVDPSVTMFTDTNVPTPPSDSQTSSQVVLKPMKDIGPTLAPDSKTTSADLPITILTDTNAPSPSCTQSGSQNDGLAMTPDLNASTPPSGSQTDSQVVLKPTTDDGPTLTSDLKITSLDPSITTLTDANTPLAPSYTQSGSQDDLKLIKDDGPAIIPDLQKTSRDPTVTMFTDSNESLLLNCTQTGSDDALKTATVDVNASPPCPCFDDIMLPCFLEKFLPEEPENTQPSNKINPLMARESASVPGLVDLNKAVDVAEGKIPEETIPPAPVVPAAQIPQAKPQRKLPNIPASRGIHRRPGKIVIFEHHQFSGQSFEFYRDQPDATHMKLSSVISVKVVRGCWILYEKPGFEGRCIPLEEEGVIELPNQWTEEGEETSAPVVIGSIRLAVIDYTPPRIELFTEPAGMGRSSEFVDETVEVGSFNRPQSTGSIKVHSGLWMVYSDPGFQGLLAVLEAGEYPFPEAWGFPSPVVGSLRPLRMGALKVEKPNAVKAVLYEKAGLEGRCMEVQGDVFSFTRTETDPSDPDDHGLNCVESLKILGGLWVGYDDEGFEGQQFVLEEGEYLDWTDWGGTGEQLLSLRPVFMDFSSPHMKMFSEPDFSERGVCMDLLEPMDNAMNTRYGPQTRSIEVLAGVWVVFEGPGFTGQQYVLEKGLYGSPEDWGSSHSRVCSAVPVILENLESSCHFQMELFSESGFGGTSVLLKDSLPTIPSGFSVRSCRVHAGSWQAFSGECFSGHQCVLEEGFYPDLRTMGFSEPDASVLSLQPTGLELSVPTLLLFERSGLRGRRTPLKTASVNLQLTHSCSRVSSVLVLGGIWVLYEDLNFRGSQILLKPGAVPDWPKLSSWLRIGSLRPLIQKQVHFRLRNKEAGLLMSVIGLLDDIKLMRIQVSEETGGAEQIWTYQDGQLQCKALLDVCVCVSSGGLMSGSRVVLSAEAGTPQQLWSVSSDGIIRSHARPELVLEVKGGQQFDKHQIIVNEFHPDKLNQRWSLELL